MPAALSQSVRDAMRNRAKQVKEHLAKGQTGAFQRQWMLQGQNAVVQPGMSVIVRLVCRWDRYVVQGGKVAPNPAAAELPVYVAALEHWWDGPDGKRRREWCPKTFGPDQPCPICEAVADLRASAAQDDKALAKDLRAQEVFLFNAMLGPLGKRSFLEGKPDIRPISFHGTIFLAISDIMTGGDQESFARGDISDLREGYDLVLKRPAGKGDRWSADCAPQASPLFTQAEAANWRGWWECIPNIDEMLEKETKTYEALYEGFHGVASEPAGGGGAAADDFPGGGGAMPEAPGTASEVPGAAGDDLGLGDLGGLGDDFPGAGPASPQPQAPKPAAAGRAAAGRPQPARPGAPRGRR